MIKRIFALLMLPLGLLMCNVPDAQGVAPPNAETVAKSLLEPDQVDILHFGNERPVLLRLHVRVGDKAYNELWNSWVAKYFDWFDRNGDGVLSASEASVVSDANGLRFLLQGGIGAGRSNPVPLATLDRDGDRKVDRKEFANYYRNAGLGALRFTYSRAEATTSKRLNQSILSRVGKKSHEGLTQESVARLPALLASLDENEDEMLSTTEVNTDMVDANPYFAVPLAGATRLPPASNDDVVLIQPEQSRSELVSRLLGRYDRNKDRKLTKAEVKFSEKEFAELDRNRDGFLDSNELMGFFLRKPDLAFRVKVGTVGAVSGLFTRIGITGPVKPERIEVFNPEKREMPLSKGIRKVDGENVTVTLQDGVIQLGASEPRTRFSRVDNIRSFYLNQFEQVVEKGDSLDKTKEKEAGDQSRFIFEIFAQADKNGDNKLTRAELTGWFDLLRVLSDAHMNVTATERGQSLFAVMDANGDGLLSQRELRSAWTRLAVHAKGGTEVGEKELPKVLQMALSQGSDAGFIQPVFIGGMAATNVTTPRRPAPKWFNDMDRNADQDISPKEWIGTKEDFDAIDTDKDGLISTEEANAFAAKQKK